MADIVDLFACFGAPAKTKLLLLSAADSVTESVLARARSLNIEHVSSAHVMGREISRPTGSRVPEDRFLAAWRHWFWARKPDAGFVLTDFPATLLQAQVFDEWLEARQEALTAVVAPAASPVGEHYRNLGLLWDDPLLAA